MVIKATEFKNHVGKYLKLARFQEIIIAKNGKSIAKLIPMSGEEAPLTESLIGALKDSRCNDLRQAKEERLGGR
jgi:prevent-host-death family protein